MFFPNGTGISTQIGSVLCNLNSYGKLVLELRNAQMGIEPKTWRKAENHHNTKFGERRLPLKDTTSSDHLKRFLLLVDMINSVRSTVIRTLRRLNYCTFHTICTTCTSPLTFYWNTKRWDDYFLGCPENMAFIIIILIVGQSGLMKI